eukprot:CAMPEP_0113557836 /NCGR_PEP_ID=MMETSP0015_2-20120614/18014_1 /TAXON_ID=2838 /ORGANISM="Odontella" /LENGTH=42 /DNA_ID=CAMNT_0000459309 /DNA_START=90 /DNA_END=214 /DNA_ORIENTATION=- /assembly_acc=CAM_ASM_000160
MAESTLSALSGASNAGSAIAITFAFAAASASLAAAWWWAPPP